MNVPNRKRQLRVLIIVLFVGIVLGLLIIRIWKVNQGVDIPEIKNYAIGEAVPLEHDYFYMKNEICDGYFIQINHAEFLSYEEYLKKYDYKEEGELISRDKQTFPDMVYDIEITIENKNMVDKDNGIDVWNYWLCASDFSLQIEQELYEIANPEIEDGITAFRLRPNSKMVVHLPYGISLYSNYATLNMQVFQQRELNMVVSLYPVQKQIRIPPIGSSVI